MSERGPQFSWVALLASQLLAVWPAERLAAQDSLPPWEGGLTASLGQPTRTRFYSGVSLGFHWGDGGPLETSELLVLGASHAHGNPIVGLLSTSAEGYIGFRSTSADGGFRALVQIPVLRLSAGGDYSIRDNRLGLVVGVSLPLRRGGVLRRGDQFRAEWSPSPIGAARLTLLVPLRQPSAGRTRPRDDRVTVQGRLAARATPVSVPGLTPAISEMHQAAMRLDQLVIPHLDRPGGSPADALAPLIGELRDPRWMALRTGPGLDVDGVVRQYHAAMIHAFSVAAGGAADGPPTAEGEYAATRARELLLDRVLYPYNRLLGQWKERSTLGVLTTYARGNFARDIVSLTSLTGAQEGALLQVFGKLLESVQEIQRQEERSWGDSRLVWLPLQLGLRPEDHDTQEELDHIIEAATAEHFTDGNRVWYVVNEEFRAEVTRSIQQAEDYHVLWVHDFAGRNDRGSPDTRTLSYVVDVYLDVLTRRIREYDQRRRLPVYMLYLDQHYYEVNHARLWLNLLEHPLGSPPPLPRGFGDLAERIRAAQASLRAAVAESPLLQAEVRQYGRRWLENLVKIHVSVTNPADPSFRSSQIVPIIGVSDDLMRDHRKVAFYDINEEDPYRGMAIYTGMGIGEHYTGPTWEDRSIMVQGPALLSLKEQARHLLESQGLREEQIPYPLRQRPLARDYWTSVEQEILRRQRAGERTQRVLELHNGTGFQEKEISVARAVLYSLMPPGSVIKIPDSLWGNSLFAALLTGSALRGCRVLFVAPSRAAAPAPGWPSQALTHDLFARLIVLQQEFGMELEATGGMLKTGIYNPGVGTVDVAGRFASAYRNGRRTPFLRRLFPIDPSMDTLLAHAEALLPQRDTVQPTAPSPMPKLHLKASFFATREGWDRLVARPEMTAVLQAYLAQMLRTEAAQRDVRAAAQELAGASDRLEASFMSSLSAEEREKVTYFLLIGSANQDYRSMLMDGEASVVLSGWSGVVGVIDFSLIVNLSVWIDDLEMLDALVPPPSGVQRALARQARPAL